MRRALEDRMREAGLTVPDDGEHPEDLKLAVRVAASFGAACAGRLPPEAEEIVQNLAKEQQQDDSEGQD